MGCEPRGNKCFSRLGRFSTLWTAQRVIGAASDHRKAPNPTGKTATMPAMPTYWTKTLIPTLRQAPSDAVVPSHQLMLRAGLIHQVGSGIYDYLPLGTRSLHKAMAIVRREMDAIGAAEVLMPALQPIDLWAPGTGTGRLLDYGDNLFRLKDRHEREQALGPTHEEVVTTLFGTFVNSYKDLPKTLYQIQTKFRDEFRPRFGVLRSREFQMKDSYSFHLQLEGPGGLNESYEDHRGAYHKIFRGCGIEVMEVEAAAGPVGGDASHEFMCPSPTGEDTILVSDKGNYAANVEKCETGPRKVGPAFEALVSRQDAKAPSRQDNETSRDREGAGSVDIPEPIANLEQVHTPGIKTIDDLCAFWKKDQGSKLKAENTLKTLVCKRDQGWVVAVVRGNDELNEAKLGHAVSGELALASDAELKDSGFTIGFVGAAIAAQRENVVLVVDPSATQHQFWVTGANETDYHVKGFDWHRDVIEPLGEKAAERIIVADIRNAVAGDPSPLNDGGTLEEKKGIELGHIFKLGDKYTKALGVTVADENNQPATPIMGCYGIGVNRILAAAIENPAGHDDGGIIWPVPLAPFTVLITPIKYDGKVKEVVDQLASELESRSPRSSNVGFPAIDVLIDDRDERPGPKFKDADLIGIPVRITVGDKGLSADDPFIELKARDGSNGPKGENVPVKQAVDATLGLLQKLTPAG